MKGNEMSKKLLWAISICLLIAALLSFSLAGCKETTKDDGTVSEETTETEAVVEDETPDEAEATTEEEAEVKELVFGNIPGSLSDEWNGYTVESFKYAADKKGVEVQVLDPGWDSTKAMSNLEDLITKNVDAISVFVITPEEAQKYITKANEAGVPISFENTGLEGSVTGDIVFNVYTDYADIGYQALKYISENYPGKKVLYVNGVRGMGIVEEVQKGVDAAVEEFGTVKVDIQRDALQWDTQSAQDVVSDVIASGEEFEVIFSSNEPMGLGCYNALKDAGLEDEVPIIAWNGGPTGLKMIEDGILKATVASGVASIQGMYLFKAMYLKAAKDIDPPQKYIPMKCWVIDKDSLDTAISWEASDEIIDLIGGLDDWDTPGIFMDSYQE